MKLLFHILILTVSFNLIGCQSADSPEHHDSLAFVIQKPNAVKEYFAQNKWNFPFQMDSLLPIRFGEYPDSPQVFVDSGKIQVQRTMLFAKAVKYFTHQGIDSTCGHRFSSPSMYRHAGTVYYRLFVQKYKNNRNPKAGCECAELDSGRVFGYQCLMQFKILKDSLLYEGCMD
jgi:hypothetical protein